MINNISATDAIRNFSDIINRIRYRGEEFIIERGGEPVCRIVPALASHMTGAELKKALLGIPKPDLEYWDAVADAISAQPPLPPAPWSY